MKLHKQIYEEVEGMGVINRTLCGRENKASWDTKLEGNNISEKDEDVTCKFCLKIMDAKSSKGEDNGK